MSGLPVHGTVTVCPRCQAETITALVDYHDGAQGPACTLLRMNSENTPELLAMLEQHICRSCSTCRMVWLEAHPEVDRP